MTDPIIKAPLPPQMNETVPPPQPPNSEPVVEEVTETTPAQQPSEVQEPVWKKNLRDLKEKAIPYFWPVVGGVFFAGILFGAVLFSGSEPAQNVAPAKLPVIPNDDMRQPLKPCGIATNYEYCFLYLMNNYPSSKRVDDFIEWAHMMTGRQAYAIRPENPSYVQAIIPSGYLMKIIIPPMK